MNLLAKRYECTYNHSALGIFDCSMHPFICSLNFLRFSQLLSLLLLQFCPLHTIQNSIPSLCQCKTVLWCGIGVHCFDGKSGTKIDLKNSVKIGSKIGLMAKRKALKYVLEIFVKIFKQTFRRIKFFSPEHFYFFLLRFKFYWFLLWMNNEKGHFRFNASK